ALEWKSRIGELYHHNSQRLEQWDPESPIDQQNEHFEHQHQVVQEILHEMHAEALRLTSENEDELDEATLSLSQSARKQQLKVYQSLINHWDGLILFVDNPQVPLDKKNYAYCTSCSETASSRLATGGAVVLGVSL
ncbi:MAG: hypothetical protein GY792_05005, partial [Gammaproteobacteria bacterium]|nr:hypothetical protein [Gammaproteobacteria bacterium]